MVFPVALEGLDPLLTADALGRWNDRHRLRLGAARDEVRGVGGDGLEVGGGNFGGLASLREEADDPHRVLQPLDDAVAEETIEAGRRAGKGLLRVLAEGVDGGPRDREW